MTTTPTSAPTPPSTAPDPADVQPPIEVLPGLWWSGLPDDWVEVREQVDAVIDLSDPGPGPSGEELGELTYVKAPLEDGESLPDQVLLDHLTSLVVELVRDGRRVLVHCTFGKNRSGLIMALVVREVLGCDGATALARVRAVRDNAVNNDLFAEWLSGLPAPR